MARHDKFLYHITRNDIPPPVHVLRRPPEIVAVLPLLERGDSVMVNRSVESALKAIYRYRIKSEANRALRFVVRKINPGSCRIWRMA